MKHSVKLSTSWAKNFQLLTDKKGTHFQVKNSNWIKSIRIWSHNWVLRSRKVNLMLEFIYHLSTFMMSIDLFSIKGSTLRNLIKVSAISVKTLPYSIENVTNVLAGAENKNRQIRRLEFQVNDYTKKITFWTFLEISFESLHSESCIYSQVIALHDHFPALQNIKN